MRRDRLRSRMYRPLPLFKEVPTKQRYDYRGGGCLKWLGSIDEPGFQRIREGLEELFNSMPASSRDGYRDRLGNPADSEFFSTYFEMWCYAELKSRGWNVEEATSVDGGSKPDWSIVSASGSRTNVECKVCLKPSDDQMNEKRFVKWMGSVLRKLRNRRVRIWILEMKHGTESPKANEFARAIDEQSHSLTLEAGSPGSHDNNFEWRSSSGQWYLRYSLRVAESELSDDANVSDFVEVIIGEFGVDANVSDIVIIDEFGEDLGHKQLDDVLKAKRKQHADGPRCFVSVGTDSCTNRAQRTSEKLSKRRAARSPRMEWWRSSWPTLFTPGVCHLRNRCSIAGGRALDRARSGMAWPSPRCPMSKAGGHP